MEPLGHRAQRFGFHERHVAIKHENIAVEILDRIFGLLHGVAGAQLRLLYAVGRALAQLRFDLFAPRAHDHHAAARLQCLGARQQMLQHRSPGDGMKDLVQVRFHARPLACGKDDYGEIMRAHRSRFASKR